MIEIIQLFLQLVKGNPVLWIGLGILLVLMWLLCAFITAMVGAMAAPTEQSTPRYRFWFKALNTFVGMVQRAKSTAIENSPNFLPAVERYLAQRQGVASFQPGAQGIVTDWQQTSPPQVPPK